MRMTFKDWESICSGLEGKNFIRIDQVEEQDPNASWICLKHDVETNVKKALRKAKIEASLNIKSTYYVQSYLIQDNIDLLKEISDLGHEVTYHYDVLDSNSGDLEKAIREFDSTVKEFESYGFRVKTVCPHGNPVMDRDGWDSNKDFFRSEKVKMRYPNIFDLVVDGKKRISGNYVYISDAGYKWKLISDITDNDINLSKDIEIGDTDNLINFLSDSERVILSSHPHRWSYSSHLFKLRTQIFFTLRSMARAASKVPILKSLMSKFYSLAKKI